MRETQRDPTTIGRFFKTLAQIPEDELSPLKAFLSLRPDAAQVDFPMYCLRIPAFTEKKKIQDAPIIGPLTYNNLVVQKEGPVAVFTQHYLVHAGKVQVQEVPFTRDELLIARYDRKQPYFAYERNQFAQALRSMRPYVSGYAPAAVVRVRSCGAHEFALSFKI